MNTYSKKSLTLKTANRAIDAAIHKAIQLKMTISVVVLDESGILKAYSRMDGAPLIAFDAALKKAKTAVGFGMPSGESWYNFIKDDPILSQGVSSLDNFTLLGGGIPITLDSELVGAIGVSGGHYAQDEECAKAGYDAIK